MHVRSDLDDPADAQTAAAQGDVTQCVPQTRLHRIYDLQIRGVDPQSGFDPAGQTGGRRQLRQIAQAQGPGQRAHVLFGHARRHEGMKDAVFVCGQQPGPVIRKIVKVGPRGHDLRHPRQRTIEVGLAKIAAIDRVRAIGFVAELACINDSERQPPIRREMARPRGRGGRHRRGHRMTEADLGRSPRPRRRRRQRQTVDAAAQRNRQRWRGDQRIVQEGGQRHGALPLAGWRFSSSRPLDISRCARIRSRASTGSRSAIAAAMP